MFDLLGTQTIKVASTVAVAATNCLHLEHASVHIHFQTIHSADTLDTQHALLKHPILSITVIS